jgi:hypothetical protein
MRKTTQKNVTPVRIAASRPKHMIESTNEHAPTQIHPRAAGGASFVWCCMNWTKRSAYCCN